VTGAKKYLDRPIILLGAPCSGTTFLGQTLGHHAALAFADEPRFVWRYGNDHKSDMLSPQDAREDVKRYIRGYFATFVHDAGAARLLEKHPSNSLRPEFVATVLPDCRFIHIMRSPIDAVLAIRSGWMNHAYGTKRIPPGRLKNRMRELSWPRLPYYAKEAILRLAPERVARVLGRNIWGPRLPGIEGLLRDLEILDVCALQWRMCVETAIHFGRRLPPHRYLEIWLEDLSPQLLRQVLTFCELDDDEKVLRVFSRTHDPTLAHGRRAKADAADIDRILRWTESTMSLIGYQPP
jgi:Sulfotransferase family